MTILEINQTVSGNWETMIRFDNGDVTIFQFDHEPTETDINVEVQIYELAKQIDVIQNQISQLRGV